MTKSIVLCADDYGQALPISSAILELIEAARISATSCMVNLPHWPAHAARLRTFHGQIDIGLHFNLTTGAAISSVFKKHYGAQLPSLATCLGRAFLGLLDQATIEAECDAQLDQFVEHLGFLPDFIDGHQHVHQFPIIRDAVVRVFKRRLKGHPAYMRLVNPRLQLRAFYQKRKHYFINATGTQAFKKALLREGIPHNASFGGIYSFAPKPRYAQLFPQFLQEISDKSLIMCHPGLNEKSPHDPISKARFAEYEYLKSPVFLTDVEAAKVQLRRFGQGF